MAFKLTKTAKNLADNQNKSVNIILELDGIDTIWSAQDIGQLARIGMDGLLVGNFTIGGLFTPDNNKDLLSIKDGTTTNITQQLQADKSSSSSVSSMRIALVDKDNFVSGELASGKHIEDILSREAQVYIGFEGGSHPEDSIRIFQGNVTNFDTSAGLVLLTVSAPNNLARQAILPQAQTELTAGVDAVVTSIPVLSTKNFTLSQDSLTSYIRIDDEIIEVGTITDTSYDGCIRGQLGTNIAAHDDEAEVVSFYRLRDNPIDLLLKLYLSGEKLFNKTEPIIRIEGARVFFNSYDVENVYGLSLNDFVEVSGLVSGKRIIGFGVGNGESYIDVEDLDFDESLQVGRYADFTSKYDLLNFGAGLSASQVDVEQHEKLRVLFGGSFPSIDIYIREEITLKEFVEKEILRPIGGLFLTRQGRISMAYAAPPLIDIDTVNIDSSNVVSPEKIVVKRDTNRNFFNTITYKFDSFALEEKLQRTNILFDSDSFNQIRVGSKPMTIEAGGFRKDAGNFFQTQSRRYIDRYRLSSESYKLEVTYGVGWALEVADVVIFDGTGLDIYDSVTKSREEFKPRLMEVANKSLSATTGRVSLELQSTALSLDGVYSVISASSLIQSATSTEIILKTSFNSFEGLENEKWQDVIGGKVRIHNNDFTLDETVTLVGFDATNSNKMIVSPALSFTPTEDMIVDSPMYDDGSELQQLAYGYLMPQVDIVSVGSTTTFDVAPADIGKFFVGSILGLHLNDYSDIQDEVKILSIVGNTIEIEEARTFTNLFKIDLIGMASTESQPFRYI